MEQSSGSGKGAFRVRDYRPGDFPAVEAMWREIGLAAPWRGDDAAVIARTLGHDGARFLILEEGEGGPVVGSSWITCDGRRLFLHHFGIKASHQGRGLSKILLRASLAAVRKAGMPIKLEVAPSNIRAVELYKKAGFERLGDYDVYILRDVRGGG